MDFSSALDTSMQDFEPPKLVPTGTYVFTITKAHTLSKNKDETWEFLNFPCKIISPEDDVDPDELEEYGKVTNEPMRVNFMFPTSDEEKQSWDRSMDQLKRFLYRHLQVDADEDAPLSMALAAAVNCQFLGVVTHRPDKNNPEIVYAEVGKTAPMD